MDTIKNANSNDNLEISVYVSHICKQLFKKLISTANFEILIRRLFHPSHHYSFKDVISEDDVYVQSVSLLLNRELNYYLKTLEIIMDKDKWEIIDLKYDYYDRDENILNTDIEVNFNV